MISEVLIVHKLMPTNQDNQVLPDSRSVTAVVKSGTKCWTSKVSSFCLALNSS